IITLAFFHKLYENHSYGKFISGNKSSLEKINRDLILSHYKKYFIPNEAIVVIYGDFEEDEMLSTIKENLGKWKKGEQIKFADSEQNLIKGKNLIIIDKPDVTQTQIRFGNKGIKVNDKDYFALQVANTIFGVGFTSRLMEEIRVKRSLSYGASSSFSSFKEGGSYVISTFTKNSSVKEVFDVIFDQLKKYREIGPTDKEIEKAKNYIIGDFARDLQSPESLTSQIAELYFYNKDKMFLTNYVQNIRKVSKNEILKVINKYFLVDDLLMMIVTNNNEVNPQLIEYKNTQVINYQKIMD
ncbi:MAG: insulinase family protein, partial [Ignavibacteria bacterium]|nr:insulinase family protein [Ignavibacteria bacterium]